MLVAIAAVVALPLDPFLPRGAPRRKAAIAVCPPFVQSVPIPAEVIDWSGADAVLRASFTVGGVVWGAASHGVALHTFSAGVAGPDQPFTADTISRIGSVTKVLPTLLAFQAAEQGKLSLGDLFSSLAPSFVTPMPNGSEGGEKLVSIRSMLSQLSGLQRESPLGNVANYSTADLLSELRENPLISEPYVRPSYSNLAFALVGRGLEPLLGATFERLCEERIFSPLGLNRTGLEYNSEVVREMATGYAANGVGSKPGDLLGYTSPAGNAYSTIGDLLTLGTSLLGGSDALLSSAGKKEMLRPMWLNQDGISGFGTPWEVQIIEAAPSVSMPVQTKGGNVAGYSSLFVLIPDLNVTLSVLWNSGVDEASWGRAVLQKIVPQLYSYSLAKQVFVVPVSFALGSLLGNYSTPLVPGLNVSLSQDANMVASLYNSLDNHVLQLSFVTVMGKSVLFRFPYSMPLPPLDCQGQEETAIQGQLLHVATTASGSTIQIPGYLPGIVLTKLKQ